MASGVGHHRPGAKDFGGLPRDLPASYYHWQEEIELKREKRRGNYFYNGETRRRSWAKAIVWRIIAFFVLGIITWLVTHNWGKTSLITITYQAIQVVLYYFHERCWDNVEWGRIKAKGQVDYGEGI